jgi:hypothetical protein
VCMEFEEAFAELVGRSLTAVATTSQDTC